MKFLAQLVQDALLKLPHDRFPSRVLVRQLQRFRRHLIRRHNDPTVTYRLCGYRLKLPASHDLPYFLKIHDQYEQNLKRICDYVAFTYPEMTAIDVGANVGDTAVLMRQAGLFPILCVEGNPDFYRFLEVNVGNLPGMDLYLGLVGFADQTVQGGLQACSGTARFVPGAGNQVQTVSLQSLVERFPKFARPRFIKIDTDGWDCQILASSLSFLQEKTPVLYFEYDPFLMKSPEEGLNCLKSLEEIGYRYALIYDNLGHYLGGSDLRMRENLEDWDLYFSGRRGLTYGDLAVFHQKDEDLYRRARQQERDYVARLRPSVRLNLA